MKISEKRTGIKYRKVEYKLYAWIEKLNDLITIKLSIFLLFFLSFTSYSQDTLKLVSHPQDRFIAECNKNICGILDTIYNNFEVQVYFKTKQPVTVKLFINNKLRMTSIHKVTLYKLYAFPLYSKFRNAELWIGDKKYFFYK